MKLRSWTLVALLGGFGLVAGSALADNGGTTTQATTATATQATTSTSGPAKTQQPPARARGETGFRLVAGYGPVCTGKHTCGMQPWIGAVAKLYRGNTPVARAVTNKLGQATLIVKGATAGSFHFVATGKLRGRAYTVRKALGPAITGMIVPYYLSICVQSFGC